MSEAHESRTDAARRDDILRLTLVGLEEDLDDLRSALARELSDYEGRLRNYSEALPPWLQIPPSHLRQLFRFPEDGEFSEGLLGPRSVALAAARVETFISEWVGAQGEVRTHEFGEERVEAYRKEVTALEAALDALEKQGRTVAREADAALGDWLDEIIGELETRREDDEMALRELVGEGEVGKGRDARSEIAELWEEQRHRAAEARGAWEPLEELVFEGIDRTVEGIVDLRSMVDRAREGLRGAHPEIEESEVFDQEDEEASSLGDEESVEDDSIDEGSETVPGGAPFTGESRDDGATPGDAVDDEPRVTAMIDISEKPLEPTHPYLRESSEVETVEEFDEVVDSSAEGPVDAEEVDEEVDTERATDVEEAGETAPMNLTSDEIEAAFGSTEETSAEAAEDSEEEKAPAEEEEAEENGELAIEEQLSETAAPSRESSREVRYAGAGFRVGSGWQRVSPLERTVILGPPFLVIAFLLIMAIAEQLGVQGAVSPFRLWPSWGMRLFALAGLWLLLVPLIRRWRPAWSGFRMELLRWTEVAEEEDVVVDERALQLGPLRYRWENLEGRLFRWESREDATFGWLLDVELPGGENLIFVAPERNLTQWEQSDQKLVEVPTDAWQINPTVFQKMRDRI